MKILILEPRGFCAGVERAIRIVELAIEVYGPPIYVRREIVHNQRVVSDLRNRGAVFVEETDSIPSGNRVVMSAHGVGPQVIKRAQQSGLTVIDATCPLVAKVHIEVQRYVKKGYRIILVGHRGHDEVIGTMSESPGAVMLVTNTEEAEAIRVPGNHPLVVLTQTTLSVDDCTRIMEILRRRFPHLETPPKDDICYATTNRQQAVKDAVPLIDLLLVVGSVNSSNATRLVEVARSRGVPAHLIDSAQDIRPDWMQDINVVGLTAGASTPEKSVQETVEVLKSQYGASSAEPFQTADEGVVFKLPPELESHDPNWFQRRSAKTGS
jgi:4-hydroxy-3-methylbut-2-enyl diphosphate reductase